MICCLYYIFRNKTYVLNISFTKNTKHENPTKILHDSCVQMSCLKVMNIFFMYILKSIKQHKMPKKSLNMHKNDVLGIQCVLF